MKRLLLISDNAHLSQHLINTFKQSKSALDWKIDLRYTSYNKSPEDMEELGASKINIKNPDTVIIILRTYDLVFSLHCKQIFPRKLVESIPCYNFHPGFNPYNRGWFPQVFSIINGLTTGATVHLMDAEIDHGEILAQKEVEIRPDDTSLEAYNRIIEQEKALITEYLDPILSGKTHTFKPTKTGNYNSIEDYRKICQLDLNNTDTLRNHINLLRALTHGEFKNATYQVGDATYCVTIKVEKQPLKPNPLKDITSHNSKK